MIKLYLLSLMFIFTCAVNGFGCKEHVMLPPDTVIIVGGGVMMDYELEKGKSGINSFILSGSGNLTYQGLQLIPSVSTQGGTTRLHVYQNKLTCLAILASIQRSQPTAPLYLVNLDTLSSMRINLPGKAYVFWSPKGRYVLILTDFKGHYFTRLDTQTGHVLKGSILRNGKALLYVLNESVWEKNSDVMTFTAREDCNPLQVKNCSLNKESKIYKIQIDTATFKVSKPM